MRIKILALTIFSFPIFFFAAKAQNSDTSMNVKFIKEDNNLILPKSKNLKSFCTKLQNDWKNYTATNQVVVNAFGLDADTANYFASVRICIDNKGKVSGFENLHLYSKIDSICSIALRDAISKSQWEPSFKVNKKGRKHIARKVNIHFTITREGLVKTSFVDIDTGQTFDSCN